MPSVSFSRGAGATPAPAPAATPAPAPAAAPVNAPLINEQQIAEARALLEEAAAQQPGDPTLQTAGGQVVRSPAAAFEVVNPSRPTHPAPGEPVSSTQITRAPANANDDVDGELGLSDIKLPRLNLVQKSGKLPDQFRPGQFVFARTVVLDAPLTFIPLHMRKQYQEKIPWVQQDVTPRVFDTVAQVQANGGQIGWKDYDYQEIAHIFMLVQMPEKLPDNPDSAPVIDLFMYEIDGKKYAPMVITVASSAYTSLAKPLFTARQFQLRNGLWEGKFTLTAKLNAKGENTWHTPVPMFAGKLTPEGAAIAKQVKTGE